VFPSESVSGGSGSVTSADCPGLKVPCVPGALLPDRLLRSDVLP
jgi:hypothetical protein